MKIQYELQEGNVYNNSVRIVNTRMGDISLCAFAKHAAFAGLDLRNRLSVWGLFRIIENFIAFYPSFVRKKFSVIPSLAHDPTEKGQFSNRIGRAFADYFAKKIYKARWCVCYECVMKQKGLPLDCERPDFYCMSSTSQFVIEAKGYQRATVSNRDILDVKIQSASCMQSHQAQIPAHFSVASIAYNIYDSPIIKYLDPEGNSAEYNNELNCALRNDYYDVIRHLVKDLCFVDFKPNSQYKIAAITLWNSNPIGILLHKSILDGKREYDWVDDVEMIENEDFYIDRDGVGLCCSLPEEIEVYDVGYRLFQTE